MQTTLKQLRAAHACTERYKFLRTALGPNYGDSTPITMTQILDINGLDDCLWALSHTQDCGNFLRSFLCDCAERVLPIFEKWDATDKRPHNCIAVTRAFIEGKATREEMQQAEDWAADASRAAEAAEAARAAELQWQTDHLRELLEALP